MTGSPWRILILDRDPEDPKWLFATVSIPSDVRPAVLDASGHYQDWPEITAWVRAMFPGAVESDARARRARLDRGRAEAAVSAGDPNETLADGAEFTHGSVRAVSCQRPGSSLRPPLSDLS